MRALRLTLLFVASAAAAEVVRVPETVPLPGVGNLKAVVSSPQKTGRHPALLVVGWLSCDSVNATDPNDGFIGFSMRWSSNRASWSCASINRA
jgi:hypothetical protein